MRVGPGVKRKIHPGPEGLQLLALGGCPGKAYEITEIDRTHRGCRNALQREKAAPPSNRRAAAAIRRAQAWTSSSWTSSTGECM